VRFGVFVINVGVSQDSKFTGDLVGVLDLVIVGVLVDVGVGVRVGV